MSDTMRAGPLTGLRVLEIGHFIAAPFGARLLGDLGADVIKVETPGTGDTARRVGPFPGDIPHPETSGLYMYLDLPPRLHLHLSQELEIPPPPLDPRARKSRRNLGL